VEKKINISTAYLMWRLLRAKLSALTCGEQAAVQGLVRCWLRKKGTLGTAAVVGGWAEEECLWAVSSHTHFWVWTSVWKIL